MEKPEIAALIKKLNDTRVSDINKNDLMHKVSLQHTIDSAIIQIATKEKKTVPQIKAEIEEMIK